MILHVLASFRLSLYLFASVESKGFKASFVKTPLVDAQSTLQFRKHDIVASSLGLFTSTVN